MKKNRVVFVMLAIVLVFLSGATAETTAQTQTEALRIVKHGLEDVFSGQIYSKVQCNESGIIVWMADEGTAEKVAGFLAVGYNETCENWVQFKGKSVNLYNSIRTFAIDNGIEEPNVLFVLVDDINFETVLMAIRNEEVIFDIMCTSDSATAIKDIYSGSNKNTGTAKSKEVSVPVGKYTIGSDIPANTYTIKHNGNVLSMVTIYDANGKLVTMYTTSASAPIGKCELTDGQTIEIAGEPVIFTKYEGLGF